MTVKKAYEDMTKEELIQYIRSLEARVSPPPKKTKSRIGREIDMDSMPKRKICLKVAYFGWNYDGFAAQEHTTNTIEHHLFEALTKARLIKDRPSADYNRCGRTDKGVSALCQIISLRVRSRVVTEGVDADKAPVETEIPYVKCLNTILPPDIRILGWSPVSESFCARFSCTGRHYKYFFFANGLDLDRMKDAAELLVGSHDFRNFSKMDKSKGIQTFERVIRDVEIEPASQVFGDDDLAILPQLYTFSLTGSAFLWHQVRCIMSILFMVGKGQEKPSIVSEMLDIQKYPAKPVYELAPDYPLVLWDCTYPEGSFKLVNDEVSFEMAVDALKSRWTEESIKMSVVRSLFSHIIPKDVEKTTLVEAECKRKLERPYVPIEKRATCPPADMEHMQKYENKKIEKLKRKWGSAAIE